MAKVPLRLSYSYSIPFSKRATFFLCVAYALGFAGLLVWNFWTSAKGLQCLPYYSGIYQQDRCEPARLEFSKAYYTQPVTSASGTIGTFPWQPLAFGNGSSTPIDYSILSLNWTADPLQCVMYEQYLILDLATENSVTNACYYCSNTLRIICTSVDSQRMQVPDSSALSYTSVLNKFDRLSLLAHSIATTAQTGATIGSVRIKSERPVPQLPSGVLPVNSTSFSVTLGSTIGSFPIYSNSSNAGVAQLASYAQSLSQIVEAATERDLQPADSSGQMRTLQAPYLCRNCSKQYKPVLEIIALLITGIFGVLTPAFAAAKMLAEWYSVPPQTNQPTTMDPYFKATASTPPIPGMSAQQTPILPYFQSYGSQGPVASGSSGAASPVHGYGYQPSFNMYAPQQQNI